MAFQAAKCPNCGGDLQLPTDRASVKCMYCGGDIVVQQAIQAAGAGNVVTWMQMGNASFTAGNYEEAVTYFNKVLEVDPTSYKAWFSKGECTGWQGTLINSRLGEMFTHIDHAIDCAPEKEKPLLRLVAAESLNAVAIAHYNLAWSHMLEFAAVDNSWRDYVNRAEIVLYALHAAHSYDPKNLQVMYNIVQICMNDISGVVYNGYDPYGYLIKRVHSVTDAYSQKLTAQMQEIIAKIRAIDSSYKPPVIRKASSSACFVATAAAGDCLDPRVISLQRFRDQCLCRLAAGRGFIRMYYRYGPRLAVYLRSRPGMRRLVLHSVVEPASVIANYFLRRSAGKGRTL